MRSSIFKFIALLFTTHFCCTLAAQITGDSIPTRTAIPSEPRSLEVDSLSVTYFHLTDISTDHKLQDTLFEDFEKYATVRQFRTGALTLGNLGSSHHRIIYKPRQNILTDPGFHQYDNYKLQRESFRFYNLNSPFNDLFFSPQNGQENFLIKTRFSSNYQNDYNISLDFKRISQEGFYQDQITQSTQFGIGLWKNNKDKKHNFFYTFIANNHNEDHNGGVQIINPSGTVTDRFGEAVRLNNADSRHQHFSHAVDNFLKIGKNEKYAAHHQLVIDLGFFRYSDAGTITSQDSLVYPSSYITDTRGLRYLMQFSRFTNTVDVSFDSKAFDIQLGLKYQYSRFRPDDGLDQINDLFAFARLKAQIGKLAKLDAFGELGIGENVGNLHLNGLLSLEPISGLKLKGNLNILRYDPSLIHEQVNVTFLPVFQNDFSKINEFYISGNLFWQKLNTELEFNSGIITSPIAYDENALPFQLNGSTEYIQAIINHRWHFNWIGLENAVIYQRFTNNLFNLPEVYGIHNAYLQFSLFNDQLLSRVGGIYYSLRNETPVSFFPITGTFIPNPTGFINPNATYYEIYGDFKISQFRLYLKLENANDLFFPNRVFQVVDYPQFDWKLRLGVRWQLRG